MMNKLLLIAGLLLSISFYAQETISMRDTFWGYKYHINDKKIKPRKVNSILKN